MTEVTESSGNVFEDLGLRNPEELLIKSKIALLLVKVIEKKKMTQEQIGLILGIDQPKVSQLINGRLRLFSLGRLLRFLNLLRQDIVITIHPSLKLKGEIKVIYDKYV